MISKRVGTVHVDNVIPDLVGRAGLWGLYRGIRRRLGFKLEVLPIGFPHLPPGIRVRPLFAALPPSIRVRLLFFIHGPVRRSPEALAEV